ncbi:RCC1 domain-containing protein [Actinomyces bovis]|nr:hypothetical protein [Actinomyces bovis]
MSPEEILRQVGNDAAKAWEALHSGQNWTPAQREWLRSVVAVGKPETAAAVEVAPVQAASIPTVPLRTTPTQVEADATVPVSTAPPQAEADLTVPVRTFPAHAEPLKAAPETIAPVRAVPAASASAPSAAPAYAAPSQPAAIQSTFPEPAAAQAAGVHAASAGAGSAFSPAGAGAGTPAKLQAGIPVPIYARSSSPAGTAAAPYGMPSGPTAQPTPPTASRFAATANKGKAPKSKRSGRSKGARWGVLAVVALALLAIGGLLWAWKSGILPGLGKDKAPTPAASQEPAATTEPTAPPAGGGPAGAPAVLRSGTGSYICSSAGQGVQCWGTKLDKQKVPLAPISGLENVKVVGLSVGHGFATAVGDDGTVYTWGANDKGQLGTAAGANSAAAVKVGTLPGKPSQIVTGNEHSCALVNGEVYCYGGNRFGQVTGASTKEPVGVTKVEGVTGAVQLGTSGYDAWAITAEGSWAWGNNTWGQVADGAGKVAKPTFTPAK